MKQISKRSLIAFILFLQSSQTCWGSFWFISRCIYICNQAARKNGDESIHFAQIGEQLQAIANWLTWVSIQLRKNKKINGPPISPVTTLANGLSEYIRYDWIETK